MWSVRLRSAGLGVAAVAVALLWRGAAAGGDAWPSAVAQSDDGMQCGNRLVTLGDGMVDVLLKCGEPMFKETRSGAGGFRSKPVVIDVWTYNQGRGRFLRILTFKNGLVTSIEAGAYVP
jgi:hypothetical protein